MGLQGELLDTYKPPQLALREVQGLFGNQKDIHVWGHFFLFKVEFSLKKYKTKIGYFLSRKRKFTLLPSKKNIYLCLHSLGMVQNWNSMVNGTFAEVSNRSKKIRRLRQKSTKQTKGQKTEGLPWWQSFWRFFLEYSIFFGHLFADGICFDLTAFNRCR